MSVSRRAADLRLKLGDIFADESNTYVSFGKDWWSIAYYPKYPERTAGDLIVYGNPEKHQFSIMGNLQALIPTKINFSDLDDLIDHLREAEA